MQTKKDRVRGEGEKRRRTFEEEVLHSRHRLFENLNEGFPRLLFEKNANLSLSMTMHKNVKIESNECKKDV